MLPVSRDMQSVLRDLRALYRCWGLETVYCTPYGVVLTNRTKRLALRVARRYTAEGCRHRFVVSKLRHLLRWAFYAVRRDRTPMRFLLTYKAEMLKLVSLMGGDRCARAADPCCICLNGGYGRWWRSSGCGHCFHVRCISTHFVQSSCCPLCRVNVITE